MLYTKLNLGDGDDITTRAMNIIETIAECCVSDISAHKHDSIYLTKVLANATYWCADNGDLCDADTLQGDHAAALIGHGASLPIGAMVFWDGALANIPTGWQLADGGNGTLDMRNFFPMCSSESHAIGSTRGAANNTPEGNIWDDGHALTISEIPAHLHDVVDYYYLPGTAVMAVYTGGTYPTYQYNYSTKTTTTNPAGGNAPHYHYNAVWDAEEISNIPPYIGLYIIERVS
jgi:hypothetical protein